MLRFIPAAFGFTDLFQMCIRGDKFGGWIGSIAVD
jgi:hypothetical protein